MRNANKASLALPEMDDHKSNEGKNKRRVGEVSDDEEEEEEERIPFNADGRDEGAGGGRERHDNQPSEGIGRGTPS